jgi:chromosome segregation ATPase
MGVHVANLGGINATEAQLERGINVLVGENATNRTSFLHAVGAALSGHDATLKGDADEGEVEVTFGEQTYQYSVSRDETGIIQSSMPYLEAEDQSEYAELFAYLFENNSAREAIRRNSGLYDVIMGPVDTAAIEQEIERTKQRRDTKQRRLEEVTTQLDELPGLYERRDDVEEEITSVTDSLEATREEMEQAQGSVDASETQAAAVDQKLETLRTKRADLADVESQIETTTERISTLEANRDDYEAELAELSIDDDELANLEAELGDLRDQVSRKESMMNELQNIIQFNQDMLEEETVDDDLFAALQAGTDQYETESSPTDQLVAGGDEQVTCWTCGNPTEEGNIAETITRIRAVHEDLFGERRRLNERIDELETRRSDLEADRARRETLREKVDEADAELTRRRRTLDQLETQREALTAEVDELEATVDHLQEKQNSRILDLQKEVSDLEYELERLRENHDEVTERIETVESLQDEREQLTQDIEKLRDDLAHLRSRIEVLETQTVEEFNEHMDEVLAILEYANLDRIWLEQTTTETRDGRKTVEQTEYALHVARTTADGTVYQDRVEHLSESEREVTGLVFALAGYLVHDVHETLPVILFDSLEALDSRRIARLLEYFEQFADILVAALLPEDAEELAQSSANTVTF